MSTGTELYYERRAAEYDLVYTKPERQPDIEWLRDSITDSLRDRRVLEVATGTGFWTQFYADHVASVVATDVNPATLDVARSRRSWPTSVRFEQADAFALSKVDGEFDAVFAGFLWSHIPLARIDELLAGINDRVGRGAVVLVADNNYVHGSNHRITRTDDDGNTYQTRHLTDGTEWEVLKNFPSHDQLATTLASFGTHVEIASSHYFWTAKYLSR